MVKFHFFLDSKGREANQETKKNNQSRYKRFPRNCCHQLRSCLSVSDAMEKDYIIFSQDGRRTKSRKTSEKKNAGDMTAERSAEMFRVSYATDYCN